jgi:hypothetical protein
LFVSHLKEYLFIGSFSHNLKAGIGAIGAGRASTKLANNAIMGMALMNVIMGIGWYSFNQDVI